MSDSRTRPAATVTVLPFMLMLHPQHRNALLPSSACLPLSACTLLHTLRVVSPRLPRLHQQRMNQAKVHVSPAPLEGG